MEQGVHDYYEGTKKMAIIDNTNANYIKVVLTDRPAKYLQCFFLDLPFKELVKRCKAMRDIGINTM